jgi:hypothetical protein
MFEFVLISNLIFYIVLSLTCQICTVVSKYNICVATISVLYIDLFSQSIGLYSLQRFLFLCAKIVKLHESTVWLSAVLICDIWYLAVKKLVSSKPQIFVCIYAHCAKVTFQKAYYFSTRHVYNLKSCSIQFMYCSL